MSSKGFITKEFIEQYEANGNEAVARIRKMVAELAIVDARGEVVGIRPGTTLAQTVALKAQIDAMNAAMDIRRTETKALLKEYTDLADSKEKTNGQFKEINQKYGTNFETD